MPDEAEPTFDPMLAPNPEPVVWELGIARSDSGGSALILRFHTPGRIACYFLQPGQAADLGKGLRAMAAEIMQEAGRLAVPDLVIPGITFNGEKHLRRATE